MNDLDKSRIKDCADAIGLQVEWRHGEWRHGDRWAYYQDTVWPNGEWVTYDPIHNDSQALQLIRRLELDVDPPHGSSMGWIVTCQRVLDDGGWLDTVAEQSDPNLNCAIVMCASDYWIWLSSQTTTRTT